MNRGIFGGGAFSVARGRQVRMIGGPQRVVAEIGIARLTGATRDRSGQMSYAAMPPFLPRSLREDLHHGGNSLCFAIQIAHLMGADPIYAVGFTLQSGSGYFYGRTNPVTRKQTVYQHERAIAWCKWYESKFPGRVRLDPSFEGPIYSAFAKATVEEMSSVRKRESSSGFSSEMQEVHQRSEDGQLREGPSQDPSESDGLLPKVSGNGQGAREAKHRKASGKAPGQVPDRETPTVRKAPPPTRVL